MLNKIFLQGRLVADPELRHTPNSIPVTRFTLAVDRNFSSQSGERQTDFIDITAWRKTAEFVSRYFTKGRMAVVSGRLQIRDWTDRDGGKRRSAEVVADSVYFGDSKRDQGSSGDFAPPSGGQSYSDYTGGYTSPVTASDFAELDDDDGDLPF